MTHEMYAAKMAEILEAQSKAIAAAKTDSEKLNVVIAYNETIKALTNAYTSNK